MLFDLLSDVSDAVWQCPPTSAAWRRLKGRLHPAAPAALAPCPLAQEAASPPAGDAADDSGDRAFPSEGGGRAGGAAGDSASERRSAPARWSCPDPLLLFADARQCSPTSAARQGGLPPAAPPAPSDARSPAPPPPSPGDALSPTLSLSRSPPVHWAWPHPLLMLVDADALQCSSAWTCSPPPQPVPLLLSAEEEALLVADDGGECRAHSASIMSLV